MRSGSGERCTAAPDVILIGLPKDSSEEVTADDLDGESSFTTLNVLNDEPTPIEVSALIDNAHGMREFIRQLGDYAKMLELDERKRRAFAKKLLADLDEA